MEVIHNAFFKSVDSTKSIYISVYISPDAQFFLLYSEIRYSIKPIDLIITNVFQRTHAPTAAYIKTWIIKLFVSTVCTSSAERFSRAAHILPISYVL